MSREIGSGLRDREERGFMSDKLQTANWLVKALHQRANNIMKVSTGICPQADGFFSHGVSICAR